MNRWDAVKLGIIVLVLAGTVLLLSKIERMEGSNETELVRSAVRDAAVTCYAVEGAYPESVEYLREHYQLAYNEEEYFITYEAFASNRIPDIYVTERGHRAP